MVTFNVDKDKLEFLENNSERLRGTSVPKLVQINLDMEYADNKDIAKLSEFIKKGNKTVGQVFDWLDKEYGMQQPKSWATQIFGSVQRENIVVAWEPSPNIDAKKILETRFIKALADVSAGITPTTQGIKQAQQDKAYSTRTDLFKLRAAEQQKSLHGMKLSRRLGSPEATGNMRWDR